MNRTEKILQHVNPRGRGIEIGPSHSPIAAKKHGFNVEIIDHMSQQQLIEKYREHNVSLGDIEEVDYVWSGEKYCDLTGKQKHYDWIIASHVIEHTPDLIAFLNDCDEILREDGILSLAVPDKRFCFDHFRPITALSKVIDAHVHEAKVHTPGTVAEYFMNVVSKGGEIAWGESNGEGEYALIHTVEDASQAMDSVQQHNAYVDVHAWCFVPHSFRLLIHDLFSLGLIPFKEVGFHPAEGFEFYVTLGRQGDGVGMSRMALLEIIEKEISGIGNVSDQSQNRMITQPVNLIKRLRRRFMCKPEND